MDLILGEVETSESGTLETSPPILRMSVRRGKPEVASVW